MDENTDTGWFEAVDPDGLDGARESIEHGSAETPREWPARAIEAGFADDEDQYYALLREAATGTAREVARERGRADDQLLKHGVRAMDDCERTANELAERVAEWAESRYDDSGTGIEYARTLAQRSPEGTAEQGSTSPDSGTPENFRENAADERLISLAERVDDLADEAADLRSFIHRTAPDVAPNLTALAGPVLAARLLALCGGLESLAKKPSGTVQVLGAEDALFAHLRGQAPSPKHGVIYTHEAIRGTDPGDRGSAARALAGKLAIAARVDYYSGDLRPELAAELADRIETIRSRTGGGDGE